MTSLNSAFKWRRVARLMLASRMMDNLEEEELYPQGVVPYQFSARGHELGQVLLSQLLDRPGDAASVYYRSRPFVLGAGLSLETAFASGMARVGGVSAGRDVGVVFNRPGLREGRLTILPMAGDVGTQYTPAAGWAQALHYRVRELGEDAFGGSIAVVFGGDGSVASNGFWSALNIATTLRLPLLFIVEDNGYAISVRRSLQTPGGNIAANLAAWPGLAIWEGSGTDPHETADLVTTAVATVRRWEGPGLLRLTVPRLSGHSSHDNQAYKPDALVQEEWSRDPLPALRAALVPALLSAAAWDQLAEEVEAEVESARRAALAQAEPAPARVGDHVWAAPGERARQGGQPDGEHKLPAGESSPKPPTSRRINMIEAIRRTLDVELALNPNVLIFGEDVGEKGGVHTATLGLQQQYGEARVFDTSLSEEGIIGRATGMALAGLRPVPEIQFRKYADPATEQIHNLGTLRWRTANRFSAPVVVRIPGGFGRKVGDPWHSVSGEADFAHAVGWRIAYPSNAEDAVGLLRSALRGEDPTIFFEHRAQLDAPWARRPYPGDEYVLPFGRARRVREGNSLSVVTWGALVERCLEAAEGWPGAVEILDLRTIIPWDREAVLASVRKTAKLLVVHEDFAVAGFGAEIVATIAQEAFIYLDAPLRRLAAPSVPVPFNRRMMDEVIPTVAAIRAEIEALLAF